MNDNIRKYRRCIETSDIRCHVLVPQKHSSQHKDTIVIDEHPYWHSFADGFVEGFSFPFAVLFGIAGCTPQSNPPIIIYDDTSGELFPDVQVLTDGGFDVTFQKETAAALIDVAPVDVGVAKKEIFSTKPDLGFIETTDVEDAVDSELDIVSDLMADAELEDSVGLDAVEDLPESMTDIALDIGPDVESDAAADVADVVAPEAITDTKIDVGVEDAAETVDAQDAGIKDSVADSASDVDAPICQYFCDAGKSETTDTYTPKGDVVSNVCGSLFAPLNSVAVACTNMLQGAKSCVAECAFFDKSEMTFSTDPNVANKFYKTFGDIQFGFFVPYEKITWTAFAPLKSDNSPVAFPIFMGSANVYVFNTEKYNNTGMYIWETQDENSKFKKTDYLQLIYQPKDEFFNTTPEFLEQSQVTSTGGIMTYRYPCDTLPNPIVQCADVTPALSKWGPIPSGQVFCTADNPLYNTILKASGTAYFSPMCAYLDTIEVLTITKDANGKKQFSDKVIPLDITQFNVNFSDLSDVALKSSTSIFVKFNALLPSGNNLPLDPAFTSGDTELEFKLDPTFDLTKDPTWITKDPQGHDVTAKYNAAAGATPAYLSVSYAKGAGLFANYTFPCVIPNASAPIDYSKSPGDYAKCPQKAMKP